ncbi:hypothetical protein HX096_04315 [Empedobacter falsenii]|uniref:hypothetical protein n=1 Tax=Empedobacter falsenii TaxID=343874 RepID=UPI002577328C|nr:hypothetical protein [Empedobacter falsenii]MDM1547079.1 hypothetical protein [Empedobacter falsenii]
MRNNSTYSYPTCLAFVATYFEVLQLLVSTHLVQLEACLAGAVYWYMKKQTE